jgi:AraC-like DNA-binding protein
MRVLSFLPCLALRPYVRLLQVHEAPVAATYAVLPGTGLVLGVQYRGGLAYHASGQRIALAPAGITGICEGFRQFENQAGTGTVLVVFHEGGAAPFFRLPLYELARQSVGLADLLPRPELAALEDALGQATSDEARVQAVEQLLLARLQPPAAPDRLVQGALALLHSSHGTLRVAELARQLGSSASPLEKRFRQAVGASPKKLAGIIRLQAALGQHRPGQSLTELALAAGFYDQAHFIHAFQVFTGQTPTAYFRDAQ